MGYTWTQNLAPHCGGLERVPEARPNDNPSTVGNTLNQFGRHFIQDGAICDLLFPGDKPRTVDQIPVLDDRCIQDAWLRFCREHNICPRCAGTGSRDGNDCQVTWKRKMG